MDSRMHRKTAAWACKHAGAQVWLDWIDEVSEAGTYPDSYVFGEDAPDKTGWDRYWRELVQIPHAGKRIPMHRIYDTVCLRETYPEVIRYLVHLALEAFRQGNEELGAKAAGVLTHLTGDTIQAAHTTDNRLVTMMYPQKNMRYMTHCFMELVLCDLDDSEEYAPRTLAQDEDGLVWRIAEEMENGRRKSVGEIPNLMGALLRGDTQAATESAKRSASDCARLNADILHSLSEIVAGTARMDPVLSLTKLSPVDVDVDNMFNYEPMIDYLPGQRFDHPTRLDIGKGGVDGICLLPMMAQSYLDVRKAYATYSIEHSGYRCFACEIGIQRFRTPDEVPHYSRANETPAIFEIWLDGQVAYRSQPIQDGDAPVPVRLNLGTAREITLYVRDAREPNPLTRFVYPVFALPVLEA